MKFFMVMIALAFGCALASELQGQAPQDAPKEHSMTGCLQKGTDAGTFRLTQLEKGPATVEIAESTAKLDPHVGHKIEITGTAITGKDPKAHTMKVSAIKMISANCATASAVAQQNPALGTWKLNVAKSKYDPGPPNRSTTSKFEASGTNGVKGTTDQVTAEGTPIHYEYTANYDGKDYAVTGYAAYDMVSLRRTDPNTTLSVWKKGGTVVRIIRSVVAADGKSRTNSYVGINAQGKAYHNVTFFDKQ